MSASNEAAVLPQSLWAATAAPPIPQTELVHDDSAHSMPGRHRVKKEWEDRAFRGFDAARVAVAPAAQGPRENASF